MDVETKGKDRWLSTSKALMAFKIASTIEAKNIKTGVNF
jgi:hypothetical protein